MNTQDNPPSHEESLSIITSMIDQARRQITDNGFHFLLWGWLTMIACAGHYIMARWTEVAHPYAVWLLMIPGIIISMIYGIRQGKSAHVRTYTDRSMLWVWVAVSVSIIILQVFIHKYNYQIVPILLLLIGNATFVSGWLLRFKLLIWGGIFFWVGAILAFLTNTQYEQIGIMAVCINTGYLFPGYMLRARYKNQKNS